MQTRKFGVVLTGVVLLINETKGQPRTVLPFSTPDLAVAYAQAVIKHKSGGNGKVLTGKGIADFLATEESFADVRNEVFDDDIIILVTKSNSIGWLQTFSVRRVVLDQTFQK